MNKSIFKVFKSYHSHYIFSFHSTCFRHGQICHNGCICLACKRFRRLLLATRQHVLIKYKACVNKEAVQEAVLRSSSKISLISLTISRSCSFFRNASAKRKFNLFLKYTMGYDNIKILCLQSLCIMNSESSIWQIC